MSIIICTVTFQFNKPLENIGDKNENRSIGSDHLANFSQNFFQDIIIIPQRLVCIYIHSNSAYIEVAFNEKSAITKENLCTKYTPFTYKYIALNKKLPIMSWV